MSNIGCKICCSDEMIVGRWYKIITYPIGFNQNKDGTLIDNDFPYKYTVNYTCNSNLVTLLHDSIYIKSMGQFSIQCVDMYGNKDSKMINAIKAPTIVRTDIEMNPSSWSDLKNNISENQYISIPKGKYNFTFDSEELKIPKGTIIDFNNSIVNISITDANWKGFKLLNDFSGIVNVHFVGANMKEVTNNSASTPIINITNGYMQELRHIEFKNTSGYNICIGDWAFRGTDYQTRHYGKWTSSSASGITPTDCINGYINDNGTVDTNTVEYWTSSNTFPLSTQDTNYDCSYAVGKPNMYIPTTARLYDIAFYDENNNLIQLKRNQQFFKKYYYSSNSKYCRLSVRQINKPTESSPRDDTCYMRLLTRSNSDINTCDCVRELYCDDIYSNDTESGIMSIVGMCQDIHLNRIKCIENGWRNHWSFDIEDCWNSALGIVITHSYFGGTVCLHGVQGLSIISSILWRTQETSTNHFTTFINCLIQRIWMSGIRCNLTAINSYFDKFQVYNDKERGNYFSFGKLETSKDKEIRDKISSYIVKGFYNIGS